MFNSWIQSAPLEMLEKGVSIPLVLNISGLLMTQYSEYVCDSECSRVSERILNMSLILNMPWFWIYKSSEYTRITHGSKYVWIIHEYAWLFLGMSVFVLHFPISQFVLQCFDYLNTWSLVWTSAGGYRLFSEETKFINL